jgi:hypothetical protein
MGDLELLSRSPGAIKSNPFQSIRMKSAYAKVLNSHYENLRCDCIHMTLTSFQGHQVQLGQNLVIAVIKFTISQLSVKYLLKIPLYETAQLPLKTSSNICLE